MNWFAAAIVTGISAFVATNLDDIVILMFLFSQVNAGLRIRHIVMGQYLGFLVILLASLPGFLGGLIIPKTWIGLLGFLPIAIGISQLLERGDNDTTIQTVSTEAKKSFLLMNIGHLLPPETNRIAAITFANGGDNIAIYVPLFARSQLPEFTIILAIFLILIGVWCYVAYQLSRHPLIASFLNIYGKRLVPFVIIALGIFILTEHKSYQLFPFFQNN